ncbi:MAG: isoprenylcysteine carboxylmethyltransferase family protein [Chloroflexi bacterium]|nr:isoprenylcysteine carboxylmethyltransferase family protein [Chloroflexota bacterium]
MIQAILACLLVIGFFAVEAFLRKDRSAKSLEATVYDKSGTTFIGISFALALILPLALNFLGIGRISWVLTGWVGLVIMLLGLGLRIWSMRVLGAYYSRKLKIGDEQDIITQGPYRVIRHPGYLGTILLWVALSLALADWIAVAIVAVMMLAIYSRRIRTEEAMLLTAFGENYRQYCQHTWRLIPFIY